MLTETLEAGWCCEDELPPLQRGPEGPDLGRAGEEVQRAEGALGAVTGVQSAGCEGQVGPDHARRAGGEVVQRSGQAVRSWAAVEDEVRAAEGGAEWVSAGCGCGLQV